ncbi:hypothetical protein VSDG_03065 [Cytospora chrysosperma]|uniref:Heterokaryon incompatibility domain-containing protein n=1 Tax=Cytospora chrysosperma TaxID=252740 RepID=A0A423W8Z3_CYTCH|nr:hypothetical protein VSDG_03065 [Valsa sordida]
MADDIQESMNRGEVLSSLAKSQALFAETLARGTVPVEEEIQMRTQLAELFTQFGTRFLDQNLIEGAIQHLDTILRRIGEDSSDRARILQGLSKAKFELYRQTDSQLSLGLAVLYGRQAKELAISSNLREHSLETYIQILTNLGYVLSFRFRQKHMLRDLEESITCKREILREAAEGSEAYYLGLNNLASSLHTRYVARDSQDDEEEAQQLIHELLSSTDPGSRLHSIALGQLGVFSLARFDKTGSMDDLNEALTSCKEAFDSCSIRDDGWSGMLQQIIKLYTARHEYTQSSEDMDSLFQYSCLLFESIPLTHSSRGEILLEHLGRIEQRAFAMQSPQAFEDAIEVSQAAFAGMPERYQQKERSQLVFTHLLSQRYILSNQLEDLICLASYTASMIADHNARVSTGFKEQDVGADWIWGLIRVLEKLSGAPVESPMRQIAEEELLGAFMSCFDRDSKNYGPAALEVIHMQSGKRLEVLVAAAVANITLSDDEIESETERAKVEREVGDRELLESLSGRPSESETGSGQRNLAIDPETKRITFDFSDLVRDILGYEYGSVSPGEFIAREERMERESIETERSEGRHPNSRLCRWCRKLTKPLRPVGEGFELNAERCMVPILGDWKMILYCREECAICSLATSIITTDNGELHPDFEKVDEEARGIGISSGKLSTGESVLRINFGVSYAGELRQITNDNFHQALRQGWEQWEADIPVSAQALLNDTNGPIYNKEGQQINLTLINTWLNDCDHNHGPICNHPRPGKRMTTEIPLIFIDASQQCLVYGTSNDKYFALSYTWGQVDMFMTLKENLEERQHPQALSKVPFPKTIGDAMAVVRSLGLRFLWIDAVCIVQNDPEHKSNNIPNMDIIYGRAFATIVALAGTNADAGLPGVNPGTRRAQRIETIAINHGSSDLDYDPLHKEVVTVNIVRTPRPFYLALRMSNWNTRGWIMQERLLSRRCIYFSPEAVYFQCGQKTLIEGGVNEEFKTYIHCAPMKDEHTLKRANHDNPISDLNYMHDLEAGPRLWQAFKSYMDLVRNYSKREFTFKPDILNGFAGIFAVLDEEHFQDGVELFPDKHEEAARLVEKSRMERGDTHLLSAADKVTKDGLQGGLEQSSPTVDAASGTQALSASQGSFETFEQEAINAKVSKRKEKATAEAPSTRKLWRDPDSGKLWLWFTPPNHQQSSKRDPPAPSNVLRMKGPVVPLAAFKIAANKEYLSLPDHIHVQTSQSVRRILDSDGKHCGLYWEQGGYEWVGNGIYPDAEKSLIMVGVSSYGVCYRPREGPSGVEGPISLFDDKAFPGVGAGGLVNVLVIDENVGYPDSTGDRCTVAVIHCAAWGAAKPMTDTDS